MISGIIIGLITGAIIGWLGSLVMRTQARNLILTLIGVGAGAGGVAAAGLGDGYPVDGFCNALLAATTAMIAAALLKRRLAPPDLHTEPRDGTNPR